VYLCSWFGLWLKQGDAFAVIPVSSVSAHVLVGQVGKKQTPWEIACSQQSAPFIHYRAYFNTSKFEVEWIKLTLHLGIL
jgi:hypothetical protein